MEYMWGLVKNGSQIPNGRMPFTLPGKGRSGRGTGFGENQEFCLFILKIFETFKWRCQEGFWMLSLRSKEWAGGTHLRVVSLEIVGFKFVSV